MISLIESHVHLSLPEFATPKAPETLDLFEGGDGPGWRVQVRFADEDQSWTLRKFAVETDRIAPAFDVVCAYEVEVFVAGELLLRERLSSVVGERTFIFTRTTPPVPWVGTRRQRLKARLVLADPFAAEMLAQFHGPVDLQVAIRGEVG